ncbi:hypothetical protein [Xanthomonas medicagonis]|uniref:hypothetical protein n=1 Tax=Xanthomonas medicagonis TaxID=3160841 RepID=UPI0035146A03
MTSPLENLAGPGKQLTAEPFDAREFEGLIRSGLTRLGDARNVALALESRFAPGRATKPWRSRRTPTR